MDKNAIKISLGFGLVSGLSSLGVYYLLAHRNKPQMVQISSKDKRKFVQDAEEMQDQADIDNLLAELNKELQAYSSEPEFCADGFTFTKEFMLKLNYVTSKYQIIIQQTIKNQ
jgi:hypothetical protein